MGQKREKVRLDEVTFMRFILPLLIVFYHSFLCYCNGAWEEPAGYVDIPLYKWLCRTSFAFTLEAFVFISGYLFSFQRITLNRTGGVITNKLKRLILPSVIFSIAYFIIFYQYQGVGITVYSIINGCGHMWYLPMSFWCFVGGWLLEQIQIHDGWKFLFVVLLSLFAFSGLPLQLSGALTFMVYFYGGFLCYKYSDKIKTMVNPRNIAIAWVVFVLCFAILRPLRDCLVVNDSVSTMQRLILRVADHACQLIYAWAGVMAFYFSAVWFASKHQLSNFAKSIAACSFGIYLFQQFVLMILYYKTEFPVVVGPYWLPWCGFAVASAASYCMSVLLLKTKTGRFLIG